MADFDSLIRNAEPANSRWVGATTIWEFWKSGSSRIASRHPAMLGMHVAGTLRAEKWSNPIAPPVSTIEDGGAEPFVHL
jgi:hypothetical protein